MKIYIITQNIKIKGIIYKKLNEIMRIFILILKHKSVKKLDEIMRILILILKHNLMIIN